VTIVVLLLTGVVTSSQFYLPSVLPLLERTPTALHNHEWWRLITPLFVHSDGWRQIAFNFAAIVVVGTFVERILGRWPWLLLYFTCGFIGETAGYAWKPSGAGNSVAGAGLLGALAIWLVTQTKTVQGKSGGAILLLGGAILTCAKDLHGPPLLAGAVMGWFMLPGRKD